MVRKAQLAEIDGTTRAYLVGAEFSNRYRLRFEGSRNAEPIDRFGWLAERVSGKSVIHVGCCDHQPLILRKRTKKLWLHDHLRESAAHCVGIDIDEKAVKFVTEELGHRDVYAGDVLDVSIREINRQPWDYMILGEVLEHVDNPVWFLERLANKYRGKVQEVIITVPNAWGYKNLRNALRHREYINSDHRYWFTPYTLAKVTYRAGLKPRGFLFVTSSPMEVRGLTSWLRKGLLSHWPALRERLILVAEI